MLGEWDEPITTIEYLKQPLSASQIRELLGQLRCSAREILRTKGDPYEASGLSEASGEDDVIAAIARDPLLLQRPIVVRAGRAVLARPPERVRELFAPD